MSFFLSYQLLTFVHLDGFSGILCVTTLQTIPDQAKSLGVLLDELVKVLEVETWSAFSVLQRTTLSNSELEGMRLQRFMFH